MGAIQVTCPSCQVRLSVPEGTVKRFIRCGRCKHRFALADQPEAVESAVASWLFDDEDPDKADQQAPSEMDLVGSESLLLEPDGDQDTSAAPSSGRPAEIRCVKVEHRGALFEFPANRLLEPAFRTAFPRQCLSCDSRAHLRAHVVIFSAQLLDSVSMEAEHSSGALVLSNEEVRGLSGQEVLSRLPMVPNVPHPGDLPMPYWVCDMCSGSGTVRGQIQVNPSTGKGFCRLYIRNIHRALEFMIAAGGRSNEGCQTLQERVEQTQVHPWDNLPEVVQHRIDQWFKPEGAEVFLAYVPDRDHVRTEDGMAGVLISTIRLIYHTPRRHRESTVREPLELQHAAGAGKGSVSVRTPGWSIRHMAVDRDGISQMRRGLTLGKFLAVWH